MFKKIISIIICIILIVSCWLMPVSAVEISNDYPEVGTMFNKVYTRNGVLCNSVAKVPLRIGANPILYYNWIDAYSNDNTMIITNMCLNIKDFKLRKDIEYTISFDIVFDSAFANYISNWAGGIFNYASVDFSNPFNSSNYDYVNKGCIYNFTRELDGVEDSLNWSNGGTVDGRVLRTYKVEFKIVPTKDIVLKSVFYAFAVDRYQFTQCYGISNPLISYVYNGEHYEEDKANSDGNSAINEALDIIPNDSEKFVNAIGNLANSVSYNGTDAKLTIPAMYIPAMSGMGDRINLTNEIEFNFSPYIQMIPSTILLVIQIILTLALIVYCFKELYGIIQMVMVNKGGGE